MTDARSAAYPHPEVHSSAADSRLGLGREGMVTVWDDEGRYVGCMGVELWRHLLTMETCPECGMGGEHGLGCPVGPYPLAGETMGSVSPCFVNCGAPACLKLGCVRVYNERHQNDREVRAWNGD